MRFYQGMCGRWPRGEQQRHGGRNQGQFDDTWLPPVCLCFVALGAYRESALSRIPWGMAICLSNTYMDQVALCSRLQGYLMRQTQSHEHGSCARRDTCKDWLSFESATSVPRFGCISRFVSGRFGLSLPLVCSRYFAPVWCWQPTSLCNDILIRNMPTPASLPDMP